MFESWHPWTQWGFWDGFWFVIIAGTILWAYSKACKNDRKAKKLSRIN